MCRSGKLQYFLQYFQLLYCLFHFGRVLQSGNEQCFWWWCCHSYELGIGPMVLLGRVSSVWWLSLGLTNDRSPLRSWYKSLSALDCDNSIGISKSGSSASMVHLGGCDLVPPCWYGLDTAHWISCKPGLLLRLDGTLQ